MKKPLKITLLSLVILICGVLIEHIWPKHIAIAPEIIAPTPVKVADTPEPAVLPEEVHTGPYYKITLSTASPLKELRDFVGQDNLDTVLKLNRIDGKFLKTGSIVVIPENYDFLVMSPFPANLTIAQPVNKLMLIDQKIQAFVVYENGFLVRWGPISSGKQSTPTANKLYFTNWKGKEVHSSFSDEWVLKWNFNLDNREGIGMHQYEMPGYPASHSCVRMFDSDAMWLYNWADQWALTEDEQTIVAHGTPVIIFGDYAYGKTAPWKLLPENPESTNVSSDELEKVINPYLNEILEKQAERMSL